MSARTRIPPGGERGSGSSLSPLSMTQNHGFDGFSCVVGPAVKHYCSGSKNSVNVTNTFPASSRMETGAGQSKKDGESSSEEKQQQQQHPGDIAPPVVSAGLLSQASTMMATATPQPTSLAQQLLPSAATVMPASQPVSFLPLPARSSASDFFPELQVALDPGGTGTGVGPQSDPKQGQSSDQAGVASAGATLDYLFPQPRSTPPTASPATGVVQEAVAQGPAFTSRQAGRNLKRESQRFEEQEHGDSGRGVLRRRLSSLAGNPFTPAMAAGQHSLPSGAAGSSQPAAVRAIASPAAAASSAAAGPSSGPMGGPASDDENSPNEHSQEARRKAHREYTQKSREKVNARFEALMRALPPPPPRINPRSKAEILEYATDAVLELTAQNKLLGMKLALSSPPDLEAWLMRQMQNARTVRDVCQPILQLLAGGLNWSGAEVWAIDSRAPKGSNALGQAWTYIPADPKGHVTHREHTRKLNLGAFLSSGQGTFFLVDSNESIAVAYRSGKPAWLSCSSGRRTLELTDAVMGRTAHAYQNFGITDMLLVPLTMYGHVQVVLALYLAQSEAPIDAALPDSLDPAPSLLTSVKIINIIARRFKGVGGPS